MIVGAGMAGLIAAHLMPRHEVYELEEARKDNPHKALLRFRSSAVADATGVEFRPVTIHKGIWLDGTWQQPTIENANLYALKVIGKLTERSIWDLAPAQRWIAPDDFYERLVDGLGTRIHWGCTASPVDAQHSAEPFITTAPMPATLAALGITDHPDFSFAPIFVKRYRVAGCDVHQTVYFPTKDHSLYRASITGDVLICEFAKDPAGESGWSEDVVDAFALNDCEVSSASEDARQEFGKLVPIPDVVRKRLIGTLTTRAGVYSLGRYATWRNILLDDVVKDALVIKRLIAVSDYERRMYY